MKDLLLRKIAFQIVVAASVIGMSVSAQTGFIDSSGDHLWSNAANWNNGFPVSTSAVSQTSNTGTDLILNSSADVATFNNGNNSTSLFTIASGGDLTTGDRFDVGNSDSAGVGMLQVDGGSLYVGGQFQFGRYGSRSGIAALNAGSITVDDLTQIAGWNSGTGELTINDGTFTANNHMNVGLAGAGALTVNGGNLFVTNAFKFLHVSPNGADGLLVINGGVVTVDALKTDGNIDGTPRIEVNGGLLKINRSGSAGFDVANDDTEFFIGNGTVVQSGNSLDGFTQAITNGFITWDGTGTNMLTEYWDLSFTNGTDSLLFVDYNDANPGHTTMWVYEPTGGSTSNESTLVSSDGVLVYTNVPGLAPSEFYSFRVRSVGSTNWLSPFAWITRCIPDSQENRDNTHYYCRWLGDWSNTYINFELSNNVPVEIEISKVGGAPIINAVPHPRRKVKSWRIEDGKAYVVIDQPTLFAVDIDGQMDTQATARTVANGWTDDYFYDGPPIHTVTIFANPVIDKPDINDPSVYVVEPGEAVPETGSWSTLYFKPGIHQLFTGNRLDTYYDGCDFQLKSDKSYYIPGDAMVYGHMNSYDNARGDIMTSNARVYGYGTLSGARSSHPEEMTTFVDHMSDDGKRIRGLVITYASGCTIEGVTMADSANHTCKLDTRWQQYSNTADINYVKWAKVFTWRGNGDGISTAGNGYIENCFMRTQDDGTYLSGLGVSNVVYWSDANGAAFRCDPITVKKKENYPAWLPDKYYVEDIDIIYARCVFGPRYAISRNGGSNGQLLDGGETNTAQHLVFRNINLEDPFPNRRMLGLVSTEEGGGIGDLSGIRFENIRVAAPLFPSGETNILSGYEAVDHRSHIHDLVFDNFVSAGEQIDHLDDFEHNQYAYDMIFSNTAPETMTFLNTSGYGKWYVYGDWDSGSEPASHDNVQHTAVAEILNVDAVAYAANVTVAHTNIATLAVLRGGELIVGNDIELGGDAASIGILDLQSGAVRVDGDFTVNEGSRIDFGEGILQWKGNRISDLMALVNSGGIHWSDGKTDMLTASWDASWTNNGNILYADFDTVASGYTTVWVYDLYPGVSGYNLFALQYNLPGGPDDDDDLDGISNFGEYALNGNPTNASDTGFVEIQFDSELFTFTHASNVVDSSLVYTLLDSTNLMTGFVNTNAWDLQTFGPVVSDYAIVSNHYNLAEESTRFIQLQIGQ